MSRRTPQHLLLLLFIFEGDTWTSIPIKRSRTRYSPQPRCNDDLAESRAFLACQGCPRGLATRPTDSTVTRHGVAWSMSMVRHLLQCLLGHFCSKCHFSVSAVQCQSSLWKKDGERGDVTFAIWDGWRPTATRLIKSSSSQKASSWDSLGVADRLSSFTLYDFHLDVNETREMLRHIRVMPRRLPAAYA